MSPAAVLRRELRALAALPQTYAIAAAFFALSGTFFVTLLLRSPVPDLERWYSNIASTLIVLAPVVAMRSFAEERRSGVLDVTLAWPLPRTSLVLGKYAANLAFTWLLLTVVWLYVRLLTRLGDVEVGKAAAGFVGILLLAAAFNALALAVSARASSPAAAGFLGFALLLGLWTLQYTEGHLLGDRLSALAPSTHLAAAGRGVLDAGDAAYFVICVFVGLGLAVVALNANRAGTFASLRRRTGAGLGGVVAVAALLSLLGPAVEAQVDLTPTKRFTVSSQTKAIAAGIDSPVRLTGFVDPDSERALQLRALVRQYRVAGIPVRLEIVDPDDQPATARRLGVRRYGQVLVRVGDRDELIDDVGQIPLTSAIARLTRDPGVACFSIGHGEGDLADENPDGLTALAGILRRQGIEPLPLALGGPGASARLARCDVVVVAGPRIPLLPEEAELLASFLHDRGRLLVMSSVSEPVRAQLNELLRGSGLGLGGAEVRDRSALADDPASVVAFSYPSESPPTRYLKSAGIPTLMIRPQPIERAAALPEEVQIVPLVASSSHSRLGDGTRGPFILAALSDTSRVAQSGTAGPAISRRLVGVMGNVEPATNRFIEAFGNADLVTGLVQWIARDDDVISAGRNFGGVNELLLTAAQRRDLVRSAIVLPTLAAFLPLPVALWRLRRG